MNGLVLGGTYALLGIGLTLIFGLMNVVNFAHGEFYTLGAYAAFAALGWAGVDFFMAVLAAIAAGAALGWLCEVTLLRPLRNESIDTTMLVMIGVWIAMQNAELLVWGGVAKSIPHPFPTAPLVLGPVAIAPLRLFVLLIAVGLIAASWLLIQKTKLGRAMRATVAESVLGGDPGRPRQPAGRDARGVVARHLRGARRRVYLVRLPRRRGLCHHYPRAALPAGRPLRASRTDRMTRVGEGFLALIALTLPLWLPSAYHLHVAIMAGIFGVLALSLNLLLGYTGQLSLGHAAFFGIGAYTSALLTLKLEWSFWPALAAAVALAGAAGWFIGRLSLKLRGAYFVLVTISFAGVISLVSVNWIELTNGPLGLPGVPAPELGPWSLRTKTAYYYLVLAAVALSYVVSRRLVDSRIGRAFVALRENEALAESIGVDVTHYLVLAAVVSAAMAGLGGSLYAHYTRFVSPEVFLFSYTVTMVIMVVAGGKGTLAGPLVGAVLFTALPEALRAATSWQWQMLAYGVLLVLLVVFMPRGIVPHISASFSRTPRQ